VCVLGWRVVAAMVSRENSMFMLHKTGEFTVHFIFGSFHITNYFILIFEHCIARTVMYCSRYYKSILGKHFM